MRISRIVYDNPEKYRWKEHLYTIEQTTSGIHGFERSIKSGLLYPVVNLAEAEIKITSEMENSRGHTRVDTLSPRVKRVAHIVPETSSWSWDTDP